MNTDIKRKEIDKYLKRVKERKIIELLITNYNNSNFYVSLVYNQVIDKLKVLYIPLDVLEKNKVKEYCCYQFMEINPMTFALKQIKDNLVNYTKNISRDYRNINMNIMNIEIDIYMNDEKYDFYMTRYLPKELVFLFEAVTLLFEHVPNILGELGNEILSLAMNQTEEIKYQLSITPTDLDKYFKIKLTTTNISYLEKVNNKYYAIIEDHLFIIEYLSNYFNIYTDDPTLVNSNDTYTILKAILDRKEIPFTKIEIEEKENKKYYLCFKNKKGKLKIIKNNKITNLSNNKIEVIEDKNKFFEE